MCACVCAFICLQFSVFVYFVLFFSASVLVFGFLSLVVVLGFGDCFEKYLNLYG